MEFQEFTNFQKAMSIQKKLLRKYFNRFPCILKNILKPIRKLNIRFKNSKYFKLFVLLNKKIKEHFLKKKKFNFFIYKFFFKIFI